MRDCPNCGEHCISSVKLALQGIVPGVVASCSKCNAMVDFKNDSALSIILSEWVLGALMLLSFIYFGILWIGLALFIVWRIVRMYFKVKGPIIDVHPNS